MAKRKAIPKAVRNKVLVDAMHRCCLCPEHHDVTDLHHIVPISEDGPNTDDNLMVICPTCHAKIHRIRNRYTPEQLRMYKERWVRLCAQGLPLDVRLARAFDYTRLPPPSIAPGLPTELYTRCRTVLLQCREFESYRTLRAVFVTDQLFPFRIGLPSADNPSELVDRCLDYLLERQLTGGRPVLPVFLATLRDRYQLGDALRDELEALCDAMQSAMAQPEL